MSSKIKLSSIKENPDNPRLIRDEKFEKLKNSIDKFPEMMNLRPMVVNREMVLLGGNMRLKALKDLGYKTISKDWVKKAEELTEEQQKEFIIKDNVGFGQWDWDILANEWDNNEMESWGMDVWKTEDDLDLSVLEDDDVSEELEEMEDGLKKRIIIECPLERFEELKRLTDEYKNSGKDLSEFLLNKLKNE